MIVKPLIRTNQMNICEIWPSLQTFSLFATSFIVAGTVSLTIRTYLHRKRKEELRELIQEFKAKDPKWKAFGVARKS